MCTLSFTGTTILTVTATDHDSGSNGAITYRIGSGARDNFVVNALMGVFTVSNNPSFDYDLFKNYTVEVCSLFIHLLINSFHYIIPFFCVVLGVG